MSYSYGDLIGTVHAIAGRPKPGSLEIGTTAFDLLKEFARPEGAPPESPREPAGYVPTPVPSALFGVPVFARGDMEPRAWRLLDHDGSVIREGAL